MARKSRVGQAPISMPELESYWKVALYLRLSVEDGDDVEQNSIGNQRKLCFAYLEDKLDMEVVNTYIDHGYSGMSYKRPGFADLYSAVMRGDVNCIIVKDISRFGREYITTSEFLQKTFPNMGVRFISINDDYDSLTPNADVEGLLLPFKMILNDAYAKDISKKIRSGIEAKMADGEFLPPMGSVPYGYIRNAEKNTYDVDQEAAPVVLRIFEMRAEGLGYSTIARTLNLEGVASPGRLRYMRGLSKDSRFKNAIWIRSTLRKMLCDSSYIGNRIHGTIKRDRLGADKVKRDKSEWLIIEDAHPALVSNELFHVVQGVNVQDRARREGYRTHAEPAVDYRRVLQGKVYCGDCGGRMYALKRDQRPNSKLSPVINFQCYGYAHSNHQKCSSHYTRQDVIISVLREVIETQVETAADLDTVASARHSTPARRNEEDETSLHSIRVRRKNIEAKQERLLVDMMDGILTRDEYECLREKYTRERDKLLDEEEHAAKRAVLEREREMTARKWIETLERYHKVPIIDRELVELLVDKIVVYEDKGIEVVLNYCNPFSNPFTSQALDRKVTVNAG